MTARPRRALVRLAATAGLVALSAALTGAPAAAHPLGNFSVNHATALRVGTDAVRADFAADLAEVPSVAALAGLDTNRDKVYAPAERDRYAASACRGHLPRLTLEIDGVRAPLRVVGTTVFLLPGEAGLTTVRLECRLTTGPVRTLGRTVVFTDGADPGRAGWREVTATGTTARLTRGTVPDRSPTTALTRYPADRLDRPLRVTRAELEVAPAPAVSAGTVAPAGAPAGVASGGVLAGLVGAPRGLVAMVVAALLAAVLGAGHALTPGHGKTLMMLSLTGQRASLPDALLIGGSVTLSHTLGVILLAALVSLSAVAAPESVLGWLGVAHGALIAGIGAALVVRRRRRSGHHHQHPPAAARLPRSGLVGLGLAGGLVPSPSALLVLVGAHALGRPAYGVALVVAYGIGMAGCLTVAGIVLARGGQRVAEGIGARHPALRGLPGLLPAVASWLVVGSGVFLALRGLAVVVA